MEMGNGCGWLHIVWKMRFEERIVWRIKVEEILVWSGSIVYSRIFVVV